MKTSELIKQGRKTLIAGRDNLSWKGEETRQAEDLLTAILDRETYDPDEEVPPGIVRRFERAIARRAKGEPIPYITGWTDFRGMRLTVKPGAFVPRASSEEAASHAVKRLVRRKDPVHLELACGIGPVALAVANEVKSARVYGADVNARAIAQARANARKLGLKNVRFYAGDLFGPLPRAIQGAVDVISVHPPYIPRAEVRTLPPELKEFEPFDSLTDKSSNGMGLFDRIARESPRWLRSGGWILVECDSQAAQLFRGRLKKEGFRDLKSHVGTFSFSRILAARAP